MRVCSAKYSWERVSKNLASSSLVPFFFDAGLISCHCIAFVSHGDDHNDERHLTANPQTKGPTWVPHPAWAKER